YPQADVTGPLVTTSEFGAYELELQYQARDEEKVEVRLACNAQGEPSHLETVFKLPRTGGSWGTLKLTVRHGKFDGRTSALGQESRSEKNFVDNLEGKLDRGHIALAGNGAAFRNIKLKPLNTKPLFNGKDLAGWKVFPGDKYKSQFTVTDKGEINVKN